MVKGRAWSHASEAAVGGCLVAEELDGCTDHARRIRM